MLLLLSTLGTLIPGLCGSQNCKQITALKRWTSSGSLPPFATLGTENENRESTRKVTEELKCTARNLTPGVVSELTEMQHGGVDHAKVKACLSHLSAVTIKEFYYIGLLCKVVGKYSCPGPWPILKCCITNRRVGGGEGLTI